MRFDDDDDVADDDVDNGDEGGGNVHGESAGDGGDDADAGDGGQHAGGSADRSGTEYEDIASVRLFYLCCGLCVHFPRCILIIGLFSICFFA